MKQVAIAEKCLAVYPWIKFGYCFVKNLSWGGASDLFRAKHMETEGYIREHSQFIVEKAKCISRFYKAN